jgi:hypothetical protein
VSPVPLMPVQGNVPLRFHNTNPSAEFEGSRFYWT